MEKIRFDKLGIEVEINTPTGEANLFEINNLFEIKETKTCVKVSCDGKRVATILQDSKVEFESGRLICYRGRVVAFGNTCVEAGKCRVFAKDKTCVLAYGGTEVRANGRAKVRALDSRVVAGGRAEVFLEGESIGYKWQRSRAKMNVLDNRVKVFNLN